MDFDIPAQSLEVALNAYGALTNVQLFVDAELAKGRQSTAVKGVLAPEVALRTLLDGTGLAVRAIGDVGFTLAPLPVGARAHASAGAPALRFDHYSAVLQTALRSALCDKQETVPGSYRALVRFWISKSGTVTRSMLVGSSGDSNRDAMLAAALRDLRIEIPPPEGLPQPVTLLITLGSLPTGYCSDRRPLLRHTGNAREYVR